MAEQNGGGPTWSLGGCPGTQTLGGVENVMVYVCAVLTGSWLEGLVCSLWYKFEGCSGVRGEAGLTEAASLGGPFNITSTSGFGLLCLLNYWLDQLHNLYHILLL